jgi:hypothetical protein
MPVVIQRESSPQQIFPRGSGPSGHSPARKNAAAQVRSGILFFVASELQWQPFVGSTCPSLWHGPCDNRILPSFTGKNSSKDQCEGSSSLLLVA